MSMCSKRFDFCLTLAEGTNSQAIKKALGRPIDFSNLRTLTASKVTIRNVAGSPASLPAPGLAFAQLKNGHACMRRLSHLERQKSLMDMLAGVPYWRRAQPFRHV